MTTTLSVSCRTHTVTISPDTPISWHQFLLFRRLQNSTLIAEASHSDASRSHHNDSPCSKVMNTTSENSGRYFPSGPSARSFILRPQPLHPLIGVLSAPGRTGIIRHTGLSSVALDHVPLCDRLQGTNIYIPLWRLRHQRSKSLHVRVHACLLLRQNVRSAVATNLLLQLRI